MSDFQGSDWRGLRLGLAIANPISVQSWSRFWACFSDSLVKLVPSRAERPYASRYSFETVLAALLATQTLAPSKAAP
jgi:hypothetical protein